MQPADPDRFCGDSQRAGNNLAAASFGHLVQVIRHGLKKIQYQSRLIEGCLARTGLTLDQTGRSQDIPN